MSQISNKFLKQMATLTIKGNNTGSTANPSDLTVSQIVAMINSANQQLSNLSATAVNTALIPTTSAINLGSTSIPWSFLYAQNIQNPLTASNLGISTGAQTGSNNSGYVTIASGNTVNGTAGNIQINAGTASGSGTSGLVSIIGSSITFNNNPLTNGIWNGSTVTVPYGGTGQASFTANQVLLGGTTTTGAVQQVTGGTTGYVLTSNGTTAAPTFQAASSAFPGQKNYLSAYTASTSGGTANTGNGNFELASISGWSLAHSTLLSLAPASVASAGTAFSSTNGGTSANSNLSITTVTSGSQIAGTYSGNLAQSTGASTAGDMLISNAFYIDQEDEAKVMQIKMYYKVVTNNGLVFAGSNSNTFAVYIYDVTNAAWIQPAGVYNFTQSSGVGYLTATFQTTSNTTQYQLAIVNIVASTGAYSVYFDDISVGPQIAPSGPAITDWGNNAWTPTGSWTSNTTYTGFWRRVGDSMECTGKLTLSGAPTAANLTVNLPSGYSINTNKVNNADNNSDALGFFTTVSAGNTYGGFIAISSATSVALRVSGSSTNTQLSFISNTTPATYANGNSVEFHFTVPIQGWSSNLSMSNDTDTRIVAARYTGATASLTSSYSNVTFTTLSSDTHGAYSGATYTAPVSGYYDFGGQIYVSGTASLNGTTIVGLSQNGSIVAENDFTYAGAVTGSVGISFNFGSVLCKAGDLIIIQAKSSITLPVITASSTENFLQIARRSGPAVVAATESINMTYQDTSGGTIGTSFAVYKFGTRSFDSHAAYSTSTGLYTVPVTGKYQVSAVLQTATITLGTTQAMGIRCLYNGSTSVVYGQIQGSGGSGNYTTSCNGLVACNAGDTLQIQVSSSVATTAQTGNASANSISIIRVGN